MKISVVFLLYLTVLVVSQSNSCSQYREDAKTEMRGCVVPVLGKPAVGKCISKNICAPRVQICTYLNLNGGCSVDADCELVQRTPSSALVHRICTCKPPYTGDGFTCVLPVATETSDPSNNTNFPEPKGPNNDDDSDDDVAPPKSKDDTDDDSDDDRTPPKPKNPSDDDSDNTNPSKPKDPPKPSGPLKPKPEDDTDDDKPPKPKPENDTDDDDDATPTPTPTDETSPPPNPENDTDDDPTPTPTPTPQDETSPPPDPENDTDDPTPTPTPTPTDNSPTPTPTDNSLTPSFQNIGGTAGSIKFSKIAPRTITLVTAFHFTYNTVFVASISFGGEVYGGLTGTGCTAYVDPNDAAYTSFTLQDGEEIESIQAVATDDYVKYISFSTNTRRFEAGALDNSIRSHIAMTRLFSISGSADTCVLRGLAFSYIAAPQACSLVKNVIQDLDVPATAGVLANGINVGTILSGTTIQIGSDLQDAWRFKSTATGTNYCTNGDGASGTSSSFCQYSSTGVPDCNACYVGSENNLLISQIGQSFPIGSLVARIGTEPFFLVGLRLSEMQSKTTGTLKLYIWDDNVSDNDGSLKVHVSISGNGECV